MEPKISLCIPTKNRWNFLQNYIPRYLENKYIDEIIICDENGEDKKHIESTFPKNSKIKVYQNATILGPFLNKQKVASLAKNEYVAIIDSDNFASMDYFQAWYLYINMYGLKKDFVYCPSKAGHFDFKDSIGIYSPEMYKKVPGSTLLLNTGNYIISKNLLFKTNDNILSKEEKEMRDNAKSCESLYQSYLLLTKAKASFCIVPLMKYNHIDHSGSYYREHEKTTDREKYYSLFR